MNTIHISDSWNVLGIAYIEKTDQFVILTNVDGGYDLRLYDSSFSQYTDFGTMQTDGAVNFQDICVTGDFVLLQPLGLKDGNYLRVFSMSERKIVANVKLSYTVSNVKTLLHGQQRQDGGAGGHRRDLAGRLPHERHGKSHGRLHGQPFL